MKNVVHLQRISPVVASIVFSPNSTSTCHDLAKQGFHPGLQPGLIPLLILHYESCVEVSLLHSLPPTVCKFKVFPLSVTLFY